MSEFEYKAIDEVGLDTLSVIENANNFNRWMYDVIRPWLKGRVLEVGSGTGNISAYAIKDNFEIVLSDIRDNYRQILVDKFSGVTAVMEIINLDIVDSDFENRYSRYVGAFDSIFCLNVVEHIKDDAQALRNCSRMLKDGGTMIILVPAFQALYNEFDRQLEHYRRYTRVSLSNIFPVEMKVVYSRYFNAFGILGWFVSGKLMKKSSIPGGQMKIYDALIRVFKFADDVIFRRVGLSVIVVGTKQGKS